LWLELFFSDAGGKGVALANADDLRRVENGASGTDLNAHSLSLIIIYRFLKKEKVAIQTKVVLLSITLFRVVFDR
jgi:hypothetical protein